MRNERRSESETTRKTSSHGADKTSGKLQQNYSTQIDSNLFPFGFEAKQNKPKQNHPEHTHKHIYFIYFFPLINCKLISLIGKQWHEHTTAITTDGTRNAERLSKNKD